MDIPLRRLMLLALLAAGCQQMNVGVSGSGPVAVARIIRVRLPADPASFTSGIQEAVDALPPEGGTVLLPAGTYLLRRQVTLRANVTVAGEGPQTIITRPPVWSVKPLASITAGTVRIQMKIPPGLAIGDQLYLSTWRENGWAARKGIVRVIEGDTVKLILVDSSLDIGYDLADDLYVANFFPAFAAVDAHGVAVKDLLCEGTEISHPSFKADFVVAAIHTSRCNDVRVERVVVRNWPGDGIGIQGGAGSCVTGCLVENCRGHGLHPGTGILNSTWTGNIARRNTRDGFFFCQAVQGAVVQGNQLLENGRHGIGDLTYPDRMNVVVGNVCASNAVHGIDATGAFGNVIEGNVLRGNSRSRPGAYAGIYLKEHRGNTVRGNVCADDAVPPTQTRGVVEEASAGDNVVDGNVNLVRPGP
jgi:hypothetical protein